MTNLSYIKSGCDQKETYPTKTKIYYKSYFFGKFSINGYFPGNTEDFETIALTGIIIKSLKRMDNNNIYYWRKT